VIAAITLTPENPERPRSQIRVVPVRGSAEPGGRRACGGPHGPGRLAFARRTGEVPESVETEQKTGNVVLTASGGRAR
jgi:hypothetical protein